MRPFDYGDLVLFIDAKGRSFLRRLRRGQVAQTPSGSIVRHDDVVGRPEGSLIPTSAGQTVLALRPTLEDYIMTMPRRTQILYPKDLGRILLRGDLRPGARVMESGVGSGAATLVLLRAVGPEGRVVSYERRPEFAELARENVRRFFGVDPPNWRLEVRDVYSGIDERELDLLLLDVPEPEQAIAGAEASVRPGGLLLVWLPTTNQLHKFVSSISGRPGWGPIEVEELLLRPWHATPESVRPDHRMVAHTGFLIRLRRLAAGVVVEAEGEAEGGADVDAGTGADEEADARER
ncbi:tRNA (adenine-N1)-methyltransferase [Hydrogenibacillus sp. N12]|uniref:tRNA (adenine-N1)-methyltransferase n=1 Tax=Hydrogenibacillus sp. N12 TaxID=2866627 RepID=UPI00339D626D